MMDNENSQSGTSIRKIEANRANAKRSTGPKTVQGKDNSSHNATKHALLSKELVIPGKEKREEFDELLKELIKDLQPQTQAELLLVETIAICDWRRCALRLLKLWEIQWDSIHSGTSVRYFLLQTR